MESLNTNAVRWEAKKFSSIAKPRGVRVRTRSGSDGIIHSSCALIGSLPLPVLTKRSARSSVIHI